MAVRYKQNYLLVSLLFIGILAAAALFYPEVFGKELGKIKFACFMTLSLAVGGTILDLIVRTAMKLSKEERAVGNSPLLILTLSLPSDLAFNYCVNTIRELSGYKVTNLDPDQGRIQAIKVGRFANQEIISVALTSESKLSTKLELISLNQNTVQLFDFGRNIANIREIENGIKKFMKPTDRELKSSAQMESKASEGIIVVEKRSTFGFFDSTKGTAKAMLLVLSVVLLIALARSFVSL